MGDISPVLLAACGLAVICAGLIFVGALMLLRVARGSHGGALVGLLGGTNRDSDAEADLLPERRSRRMTSSDLQNKAQALDFDSALQKYRQTPGAQSAPQNSSLRGKAASAPRSTPTPNSLEGDDSLDELDGRSFNLRNTNNQSLRRSRRNNEDDRDEFIGGFLDGE